MSLLNKLFLTVPFALGRVTRLLLLVVTLVPIFFGATTQKVHVTELSPHLLVFATSTGNVIASVGPDGALLVGTPSASSTPGDQPDSGGSYEITSSLRRDRA